MYGSGAFTATWAKLCDKDAYWLTVVKTKKVRRDKPNDDIKMG